VIYPGSDNAIKPPVRKLGYDYKQTKENKAHIWGIKRRNHKTKNSIGNSRSNISCLRASHQKMLQESTYYIKMSTLIPEL
jgi:hypothetical protein